MKKWETKGNKEKEYQTAFGKTDYDIPTIGIKGVVFMFIAIMVGIIVIPSIVSLFSSKYVKIITILVCSIFMGFVISYAQFGFTKKTFSKRGFIIIGTLFSVLSFIILLINNYSNI